MRQMMGRLKLTVNEEKTRIRSLNYKGIRYVSFRTRTVFGHESFGFVGHKTVNDTKCRQHQGARHLTTAVSGAAHRRGSL